MNRIPQADFATFEAKWLEMTRIHDTYESSYIAAEEWHQKHYGFKRFASYASFRITRSTNIKNNQK